MPISKYTTALDKTDNVKTIATSPDLKPTVPIIQNELGHSINMNLLKQAPQSGMVICRKPLASYIQIKEIGINAPAKREMSSTRFIFVGIAASGFS